MTEYAAIATGRQRVETWFADQGWHAFAFQREAWHAWRAGEHGLIHAATGTGKTLAADTAANLQRPLDDLGLNWTLQLRTGDTPSATRQKQRKRLPTALVTTPESLSLLLSYCDTQRQLAGVQTVVVDEWHELLGSKRGVLLELALARIRVLAPDVRIWGLSATLANLDQALSVLIGPRGGGRLIHGQVPREQVIASLRPATMARFPWAGHLGLTQLEPVLAAIEASDTTLVFTNTRAQAERWFEAILRARTDWLGRVALHHGSLDRTLRARVEDGLRDGALRCVVATSSLDLGVDFSPVDRVIQVGSPKGAARLLQRAGRSGHAPGRQSTVLCVPTHALELLEIAAARRAVDAGQIEARRPPQYCLDVLAQHLVTLAAGGGFEASALRAELADTIGFQHLSEADWHWLLDFITRGGSALSAYPDFCRVTDCGDGRFVADDRRIVQRHRMAIGTINADAAIQVRFERGARLGTVEESFISRLRPGDAFLFSGRMLELVRVRELTAYVRAADKRSTAAPRWQGGRMPLSSEVADNMRALLADYAQNAPVPPELDTLRPLLALQQRWSALPVPGRLLVETVRSREGVHLFVYPFAGRAAHEGLAALVAWRLSQQAAATLTTAVNDYGFEVLGRGLAPPTGDDLRALLLPGDDLADEIEACLNAGEMAKRCFRDIARIAGLVFQGYPGRGKSTRQIQASSGLVYDVLARYDADNRLLSQAAHEVMTRELDSERLRQAAEAMAAAELVHREPPRLTPFAFPLWAERVQHRVSSEPWAERVQRMVEQLERAAPASR